MAIHDLDRAMVTFSFGLAHDLMVERLIVNIRISMTKKGYTTIKNKIHHLVPPKLLVKKWIIGLEMAKEMLNATTQDCIFSSLLPLTRR